MSAVKTDYNNIVKRKNYLQAEKYIIRQHSLLLQQQLSIAAL